MEYKCPICNSSMVERSGRRKFYGCEMYPINHCPGKRSLEGNPFGCENDEENVFQDSVPLGLNEEGERMFNAARSEGRNYKEACEMAFDWQRWQEKD